ncbi:hypothetical protein BH23CHL5_BH23CHL5_10450 [soil metagenome]
MELHNETIVNVASLLREPIGAPRSLDLALAAMPLHEDLVARGIEGQVRLTRLSDEILVAIQGSCYVELECQRCLEPFIQPVKVRFTESFRIAYDVRTGADLGGELEEDQFEISAAHELDIREPLRQEILAELPMRPSCGENCPGPPPVSTEDDEDGIDERLAGLAALLND